MTISEGTVTGKEVSGHIRGTIAVDPNFQRSQLNITCEIDADSPLLSEYKLILGSFINQQTNTLSISITGPLYDPSVGLGNEGPGSAALPPPSRGGTDASAGQRGVPRRR